MNVVHQVGDGDAVHRAGVVHPDGEGNRAARFRNIDRVGGLGDGDRGWQVVYHDCCIV